MAGLFGDDLFKSFFEFLVVFAQLFQLIAEVFDLIVDRGVGHDALDRAFGCAANATRGIVGLERPERGERGASGFAQLP